MPQITIIGGGSYQWGPVISRDIIVDKQLSGSKIVLHDKNPEPLALIAKLCKRIVAEAESDVAIESTTDLTEALTGADYVILTISTGGLDAMAHDLDIPWKYGIYQSVGDTVGPGGVARGLRNIPVVLDIARQMEKHCPDAWLLNYTNPMTTLCRAVCKETSVKTLGFCHGLYEMTGCLEKMFGLADWHQDTKFTLAGINHLPWMLELDILGQDGFGLIRDYIDSAAGAKQLGPNKIAERDEILEEFRVTFDLFEKYNAVVGGEDRHTAEFFGQYITDETRIGKDYNITITTIDWRKNYWLGKNIKAVQDQLDGTEKIDLTSSAETAADVISALEGNREFVDVFNVPNRGQIANLPRDVMVECLAVVNSLGAHPIAVGDLPDRVLGVVQTHVTNQELTVEAGITGSRQSALQAILNDPLAAKVSRAGEMLDEMLAANAQYLPQFH